MPKEMICKNCNSLFISVYGRKYCDKCRFKKNKEHNSETISNKIINKTFNRSKAKCGKYKFKNNGIQQYNSSYELVRMIELDNNGYIFFHEPIKIPYYIDGIKHNYIPDLLVIDNENASIWIEEIKSNFTKNSPIFEIKCNAAKEFAKKMNIEFHVYNYDIYKINEILEFDEIESIEEIGEEEFYGFCSPIHKNMILNDILHHNSGKDTICALMTLYCCYFLLCCNNPQKLLGLPDNEAIDIVNVAYSGEQAKFVFFEKLKQRVINNLWFKQYFNIKISNSYISEKDIVELRNEIRIGTNAILFPNLIRLFSRHSEQESTEGLNLLMFTMDEADAFKDKTKTRNADKIFNMLQTSAESRFGNKYKGFVISYPRTESGFIKRLIKLAESDLHIYADTAFTWEVKEELYKDRPTFDFEVIVKDKNNNDVKKIYKIPIDFKSTFDRNPTMAKSMYMCMPPGSQSPFIEYPDKLYACVNEFRKPIVEFEDYMENGEIKKKIKKWNIGLEDFTYILTIDLGEKHDKCGMSIFHREGARAIHDCSTVWRPIDKVTKVRYIVSFPNIRQIIKEISNRINIIVFFDHWQSSLFIQDLRNDGIKADAYTLTVKDYNNFMEFIYSQRIELLDIEELLTEIKQLERKEDGKVDHTEEGEKDLTDTVVGAIKQLFVEELKESKEGGEFIESNIEYQAGEIITDMM